MTTVPAEIRRSPIIIDTHADTSQRFADEGWSFTDPLGGGHLNLDSARAGGLAAEFFAIWPEPSQWRGHYAHRTLQLIDAVLEQVRRNPRDLRLCLTAGDILDARADGRFGVLMGIEGGHAIENSIALLRVYFHLGIRYMTLTWANSNEWADSSGDLDDPSISHHRGLTGFGKDVVREMNRLGMMVDLSHVSDQTLADVLDVSDAPVIASHSGARALTASPRNLADDQLRRIGANGGAVMVNFYPAFIDDAWRRAWDALTPERHAAQARLEAEYANQPVPHAASIRIDREFAARIDRPPLDRLIDHIHHIANVAGVDHVGIGTDFDGIPALPQEIDSAADLYRIAEALRTRGHGSDAVEKILGGNLLRIFREMETTAVNPNATVETA